MSKLFVPACGDRITVVKPWQFKLYLEYRNMAYAKLRDLIQTQQTYGVYHHGRPAGVDCVVEPGTVLECDRVYIRSTSKSAKSVDDNYDSITWRVIIDGKAAKSQRFWVKLSDCYNLEFDPGSVSRYQDRK